MASPIVPTTGLGSGLQITAIVEGLVAAERAPKQTQINQQTATTKASLSGVSQLTSALAAFQKTLDTLSSSTPAFQGFAATSSNEAMIKATAAIRPSMVPMPLTSRTWLLLQRSRQLRLVRRNRVPFRVVLWKSLKMALLKKS